MPRRLRAYAVAVAAATLAPACHTWRGRELSPDAPPALDGTRAVRLTRTDRSSIVLDRARIAGDSVVGEVGRPPERVAVAIRDVRTLEERRVSAARTGGLIVGGTAVVVLIAVAAAVAVALSQWSG